MTNGFSLFFVYFCKIYKNFNFTIYKDGEILYNNGTKWITVGKSGD